MAAPRPFMLIETNWKQVKQTTYEVAVLPWGATEAHNYHLPYGTDNIQVDYLAAAAGSLAWESGAKLAILPTIPFGVNTGQLDIPLTINMNPSTQLAILKDVAGALWGQGIKKLVIFNGHGANDSKQMIRELQGIFPDMFICTINWFKVVNRDHYFEEPGDHADEMETSAMLHIAPHLVLPLSEAGDGSINKFRLQGIQEGWVWAQRAWTKATNDTGAGNPYKATAEKGKAFLEANTHKIAGFLISLAAQDLSELYENKPL